MLDLDTDTSSGVSYLVELRKLLAKQRKDQGEDQAVRHSRGQAGLTRGENATGTRRKGQQDARAENHEEGRRHDEVGLCEHQVHGARHEREHEEEDQGVEEHGHLACLSVHKLDVFARGRQKNARAEREKKGGRERNFRRRKVREHLL